MSERRLGVFVCHCGGNISDYVDVEKVCKAVENDPGVAVAKTQMFACSDAGQQEMIDDIQKENLDGIVVASCSPSLHLFTFRAMAVRGGLNPYQYVQSNIREQCSWAHRDNVPLATDKAIHIVRSAVARALLSQPLATLRIETKPSVLVIGGGVAGLSAALALADLRLSVFVVEKASEVGGWTRKWGKMFPAGRVGSEVAGDLHERVAQNENITLFTEAELVSNAGTVGDFQAQVRVKDGSTVDLEVGAIIVATGFDNYQPFDGEFGHGQQGVITLPELKELLAKEAGSLTVNGREVRNIAYIYCVGSRQPEDGEEDQPNLYCSRYCCTATVSSAIEIHERYPEINQYHLYRDMRTYGKYELLYEEAARKGSVFLRFNDDEPPEVSVEDGQHLVKVQGQLPEGEELEVPVDLVVLVTGMVPRQNDKLVEQLKLPAGTDGFFNEIHPKLRPVETVINGVFIAGASQGPKTLAESVASSLAAVSKAAALVMKGYVDLDPFLATIDSDRCLWCGECQEACPYDAIEKVSVEGKEVARVLPALCKGGGVCVPACPEDAIDLTGYTDAQVKAMIDALAEETQASVGVSHG